MLLEANDKLMDGEGSGCVCVVCVCVSALTLTERQYNSAFVRHARYFTVLLICSNSFPTNPLTSPEGDRGCLMPLPCLEFQVWLWIPLSIFSLVWLPSPVATSDVSASASGPFSPEHVQYCFINPFTVLACKLSRLKSAHIRLQMAYFPVLSQIYF